MNYPELLTLRITVCCWSTCRIYVGYFPRLTICIYFSRLTICIYFSRLTICIYFSRLTICIYFSRLTICIYFQSLFNVTGFIYILLP